MFLTLPLHTTNNTNNTLTIHVRGSRPRVFIVHIFSVLNDVAFLPRKEMVRGAAKGWLHQTI